MMLLTSDNAELRPADERARSKTTDRGVPLMLYTNDEICWPLTDWLLHVYLNARLKASTAETYGRHLSVFLRFMQTAPRFALEELSDQMLFRFRSFLLADSRKPDNPQIKKIIRTVLEAYDHLQKKNYFGDTLVIAEDGDDCYAQVRYTIKISTFMTPRGHLVKRRSKYHPSMLGKGIKKPPRDPIPDWVIDRLWDAIPRLSPAPLITARMELALLIFECVAPRISALSMITVEAFKIALKTEKGRTPRLRFFESKREKWREAAAPAELLQKALMFILTHRKQAVEAAIKAGTIENDHGLLFVTDDGQPWQAGSIGTEIGRLRKLAGLTEPAHAHLFRHSYTTNVAEMLATQPDSPLSRSTLAARLSSRTGNSEEASMHYVHLSQARRPESLAADRNTDLMLSRGVHDRLLNSLARKLDGSTAGVAAVKVAEEIRDLLKRLVPTAA